MGLVRRETPFGESEKESKRSLYKLDDPFVRLWFRVVAPHRGQLVASRSAERLALLRKHWPALVASAWEELCAALISELDPRTALGGLGPWQRGRRWWHGNRPEWDVVSHSHDGNVALVGETKWSAQPFTKREIARLTHSVANKPLPPSLAHLSDHQLMRVLFVPGIEKGAPRRNNGVLIVTAADLLRSTKHSQVTRARRS
jgi:hypothetical protein